MAERIGKNKAAWRVKKAPKPPTPKKACAKGAGKK